MSKNNKNSDSTLGFIVFLTLVFPPAGILMIIFKYILPLLSGSGGIFSRKNRYSGYEKSGEEVLREIWNSNTSDTGKADAATRKKANTKDRGKEDKSTGSVKGYKLPYKKSSLVLLIIAGVLLFSGFYGGVSVLFEHGASVIRTEEFGACVSCLLLGGIVGGIGVYLRNKMKTAKKYLSIIGKRGLVKLDDLAKLLGVSVSKVRKELQDVIDRGVFGEYAYLDLGQGLFLRDSSFQPAEEPHTKSDVNEADADEYGVTLAKIRELNDRIEDTAVSDKIDRIEHCTGRIFEYLKKNPSREKDVHLFMTYYLPTTLKLLESYSEIERFGVAGENMKSAKENIEKTLDLLVEAYKKLLDQLYASDNMDITSDIDVLEKMMKKDGLAGNGFDVQ